MPGLTHSEKILRRHLALGDRVPMRRGEVLSLRPSKLLSHDNTAAILDKFQALGLQDIADPSQLVFALDHDIQNKSEANLAKYARIERFARAHGIPFHAAGEGIGHELMVSRGHVIPGTLCVASDSHANTYGALGALGTPVVRSDAAAIWASGEFWWIIPRIVRVDLQGELADGITGKDLILTLCVVYDQADVNNALVEFNGPGVASLSMDDRLCISNMTTEWGALSGLFEVDAVTIEYLREVRASIGDEAPFTEKDLKRWKRDPLQADADAHYDAVLNVDLSCIGKIVAGPDRVDAALTGTGVPIPIHKAYLVGCAGSRISELRVAADVLAEHGVKEGVEFYVAAASEHVQKLAEEEGIWSRLEAAGVRLLPPGCGPCIGLGEGVLQRGEVAVSATNRNYRGRMGSPRARAYLASAETVARSAVSGSMAPGCEIRLTREVQWSAMPRVKWIGRGLVSGFPTKLSARPLFLPRDDFDTDAIYPKDHTYRELTDARMAEVVMANYDASFANAVRSGDAIVSGENFGCGSSREQAVTALQRAGVEFVVASSFSWTYLRNAFNNGFLCIECPEFIAWLRGMWASKLQPVLIGAHTLQLDFVSGRLSYGEKEFEIDVPGELQQLMIVHGGIASLLSDDPQPTRS